MRHTLRGDLLPPILLLAAGTLFFRMTDADLAWAGRLAGEGEWPRGDEGLWRALYRFGTFPAILAVAAALGALVAGFRSPRWAIHRRRALYLLLLMALGPGLVANAILKDHWGRPRPRDVAGLGGLQPFEPVLAIDPASAGKSFPCGHATMGFFFVAGYFLLRRTRPAAARLFLAGGLAGGALIGWARLAQGGHFPSDTLWAGGILWLLAAGLARWLRVEDLPALPSPFRPLGWGKIAGVSLLLPALVFFSLLALPIERRADHPVPGPGPVDLRLRLENAEVRIRPGAETRIRSEVRGFGLPGSGIKSSWSLDPAATPDDPAKASFKQRRSGLTTELSQSVEVTYEPARLSRLKLELPGGSLDLLLPAEPGENRRRWQIDAGGGKVLILRGDAPLDLDVNGTEERDEPEERDRVGIRLGPEGRWELREQPLPPGK